MSLSPFVTKALVEAGLDPESVEAVVRGALAEDLRFGPDVTTAATVGASSSGEADLVSRAHGVVAGMPVVLAVLEAAGLSAAETECWCTDGATVVPGEKIATLRGALSSLLGCERTLLNFLTHLSGVATLTRQWVDALAGTGCVVRDTRKTLPGLRELEKYAVRCGGGCNHRMGLGDAALIKDNHVIAAGGITKAITAVRTASPLVPLEVECDTVAQVQEAVSAGAQLILLDNMGLDELRAAVAVRVGAPTVRFEASGGLRLENAREVADTGVDYLAVGALTHSSPALDIGLDVGGG